MRIRNFVALEDANYMMTSRCGCVSSQKTMGWKPMIRMGKMPMLHCDTHGQDAHATLIDSRKENYVSANFCGVVRGGGFVGRFRGERGCEASGRRRRQHGHSAGHSF